MPVFDDLTFDVIYNPTNIVLEVVRALPGDYDQDGDVDGDDFWIWQQDPSLGPLSDWEEHYGTSLESAANVRTTESPEPSSALVAIVTTLLGVSFELYRPQRS